MAVNGDLLLVLKSAGIGEGEAELGEKVMKTFLSVLLESGQVPARIVCMHRAVLLTTAGSPVADLMKKLEAEGTMVLSCTTCLDYYGRKDQLIVGQPTNMRDTVAAMLSFAKVITL
jgi:selenium metabolism protein YedF